MQGGKPFLWEQKVESETGRVLKPGHYVVDRKLHRISLTRHGMTRVLALLGAPDRHPCTHMSTMLLTQAGLSTVYSISCKGIQQVGSLYTCDGFSQFL